MLTRRALICYTLTCTLAAALIFSLPPAQAAPTGEPNTVTEGLAAATSEITKLGADSAHAIPTEFSSIDVENAQPYASTEVDTEAELAATSLPMTVEEMALAEVAAVVAELTTTTAAEMKAREQQMGAEEEAAQEQIRSRAEEVKRQTIEREIANVMETLEGVTVDGANLVAATTFKSAFADVIGTTQTPQTTSQTTTAAPATTESPAILNELVRAAAAANEILAAALNAASMAVTNVTATATAGVTSETATTIKPEEEAEAVEDSGGLMVVAMSDSEAMTETGVTEQPNEIETTNLAATEAHSATAVTAAATTTDERTHSAITPNAYEVSSDNLLPKALENEVLTADVANSSSEEATDVEGTTSDSNTTVKSDTESATQSVTETVTGSVTESRTESSTESVTESITGSRTESSTESVTESATESVTVMPNVEVEIQTTAVPVLSTDLAPLIEYMHENNADNGEMKHIPLTGSLEAAESNKIAATNDAVEAVETTNFEDKVESATTVRALAIENDFEAKMFNQEATQISTDVLMATPTTGAPPSEETLDESNKEASGYEIAKVREVKPEILGHKITQEKRVENEIAAQAITTTTETAKALEGPTQPTTEELKPESQSQLGQAINPETRVENKIITTITTTETSTLPEDLAQTTTEPLETLIAVESEARAPNTFVLAAEEAAEAVEEEQAATTAAITEVIKTSERVNEQSPEVSAARIATEPTTTTTTKIATLATPIEEEFIVESTTKPEAAVTTIATEVDTTTAELPAVKTVIEFATTTNDAVKAETEREPESEPDSESVGQTTATSTTTTENLTALIADETVFAPITTTTEIARAEKEFSTKEVAEVPELSTQISIGAITNGATTTEPSRETLENTATIHGVPFLNALIPIVETTTTHSEERAPETAVTVTEAVSSSTEVPLAPFTTTPIIREQLSNSEVTTPIVAEQLSNSETTTTIEAEQLSNSEVATPIVAEQLSNSEVATPTGDLIELSATQTTESGAAKELSPETTTTPAADIVTTTLSSSTTTTTPTSAPIELPTTHALEGDSIIYDKTATTGALPETTTTEAKEASIITTTTTKTEAETFTSAEHEAETTTGVVAAVEEQQPLYMRTHKEQKVVSENESTTNAQLETVTETTQFRTTIAEVTATYAPTTPPADAYTEVAATTTASMSAITTNALPTSSTPEPETTTTTTTTTLSPMSLIVAEHEARSLDRTPPRVSRIVSEDGVEVLSGYSIVHRMHAAALAALAAEGAESA